MIVTFKKLFCRTCTRMRWHEVLFSAFCLGCKNYNLEADTEAPALEVERFVG